MPLIRLIYISERNKNFHFEAEQMLESARRNNKKNYLTGVLFFSGKFFIQVLEGERRSVCDTYHKIASDPRHSNIEIITSDCCDQRLFSNWEMGFFRGYKSQSTGIFTVLYDRYP